VKRFTNIPAILAALATFTVLAGASGSHGVATTADNANGVPLVWAAGSQFTTIDDPNGVQGTFARGINLSGDIVGSYFDSAATSHGFLLSQGRFTTIDDPSAVHGTLPGGINPQGDIVGSYVDNASTFHGFLLTAQ
jgi:uncharacterized membrane protein